MENDQKEIKTRQENLEKVKKKLNDLKLNLYFGRIKSKQKLSSNCRSKKPIKSGNKQSTQPPRKVGPQRIESRLQKELFFAMAFQEVEWHAIDDVDFDSVDNDNPEITHGPRICALDNIEPSWTGA